MAKIDLDEFFTDLAAKYQGSGQLDLGATVQFHLVGEDGGDWCMNISQGRCEVRRGVAENADAVLDTSAADFVNLMTNSQEEIGWAFMQGRFNMTGNIMPLWRVLAFLRQLKAES